jgi:hypothetical protein
MGPLRGPQATTRSVPTYRLHDTTGDDLGLIEHLAPNVEPGDVVVVPDGRDALVTGMVETHGATVRGALGVAVAPSPIGGDDARP